jgi:aryl-alcohol dehydrogenase-like predicted oxidoreductase
VRTLTVGDLELTRIGLGGWPFSGIAPRPDESESLHLIHRALDGGVTLLDSADSYQLPLEQPGHNESLLARALRSRSDAGRVHVASKGGRAVDVRGERYCAASPDALRRACLGSRERLGVDAIDLYYLHRPDPAVPFADSVGTLVELAEEGAIRWIGVSNVSTAQLEQAAAIAGDRLVAVQNEFSPVARESAEQLAAARRLGLAFVAYAPFGGAARSGGLADDPVLSRAAAECGVSVHQVVLAWILAQGEHVVAIPATRRAAYLDDILAADGLRLAPEWVEAIDRSAASLG